MIRPSKPWRICSPAALGRRFCSNHAGSGLARGLGPQAACRVIVFGLAGLLVADATASPSLKLELVDGRSIEATAIHLTPGGPLRCRIDTGQTADLEIQDLIRLRPAGHPSPDPPPAPAGPLRLHLADGGILGGRLLDSSPDSPRTLSVDLGFGQTAAIPLAALAAIQTASEMSGDAEQEFAGRVASRRADRDLIVFPKDGASAVVPGSLERFSADGWEFRFGGQARAGKLTDVYGFILAAAAAPPPPRGATVLLGNGDRLGATVAAADESGVLLHAGFAENLRLPWSAIRLIQFHSPRIVFLSELDPAEVSQDSLTGAAWPVRKDANVTGGPIQLASQRYGKGLGVHARTAVTYQLDGAFERFTATVGIDDSVAPFGSVVFRVLADEDVRYESTLLRPGLAPQRISVDIAGARKLTLVTDPADELDLSDHANWAEAMLIRSKKPAAE